MEMSVRFAVLVVAAVEVSVVAILDCKEANAFCDI